MLVELDGGAFLGYASGIINSVVLSDTRGYFDGVLVRGAGLYPFFRHFFIFLFLHGNESVPVLISNGFSGQVKSFGLYGGYHFHVSRHAGAQDADKPGGQDLYLIDSYAFLKDGLSGDGKNIPFIFILGERIKIKFIFLTLTDTLWMFTHCLGRRNWPLMSSS